MSGDIRIHPDRSWKRWMNQRIRLAVGLSEDPPPICNDASESYMSPDAVARLVHGDLGSMLVGGIASLFLQMLHPGAMTGVAEHSRYKDDPFGRMLQTANFIGFTTYGSRARAYAAIERVRAVHEGVVGVTDRAEPYAANDPALLLWVHCAEISMFLEGFVRYGHEELQPGESDAYVAEMAQLATDLHVSTPPSSDSELEAALENFIPELRLCTAGADARDWLLHHVITKPLQRPVFWVLSRAAIDLLPPWAQALLGVEVSPRQARIIRPLARVLTRAIRVVVPPAPRYQIVALTDVK